MSDTIKVTVPISYLESLIRWSENLSIRLTAAERALDTYKKAERIPPVVRDAYSMSTIKAESEILRLFVLARDYPENRYAAFNQIRQLLIEEYPDQRINQIKKVRELTGTGLKEAKEFVEGSYVNIDMPRLRIKP